MKENRKNLKLYILFFILFIHSHANYNIINWINKDKELKEKTKYKKRAENQL